MAFDARYTFQYKGVAPYLGAGFGVHFLTTQVEAPALGLPHSLRAFAGEGLAHDADDERTHALGDVRHDRGPARSVPPPIRRDEHHVAAGGGGDFVLPSSTRAADQGSRRARPRVRFFRLDLVRGLVPFEGLHVGVDREEVHPRESLSIMR
jgi:hypothetical protein